MKILIVAESSLGDNISHVLPIVRVLSQDHEVHGIFFSLNGYRLLKETPFFKSTTLAVDYTKTGDVPKPGEYVYEVIRDTVKLFPEYDKVYITGYTEEKYFKQICEPKFLRNVIFHKDTSLIPGYHPRVVVEGLGLEFISIALEIEWYMEYQKDFQCRSNTVLLNCVTGNKARNYGHHDELQRLLENKGFDVKFLDWGMDIRSNVHLIYQAPHILTIETYVLWLVQSFGKVPYAILRNRLAIEDYLGCRNIVSGHYNLNVSPEYIVDRFVEEYEKRKVMFL